MNRRDSRSVSSPAVESRLMDGIRRASYLGDLVIALIARDLKLRYKRSLLGALWSLLVPLAQLLVFNFVFGHLLPLNVPHYTSFLAAGLLPWSWFQGSLLTAASTVLDGRDLVRQPGFPVAVLPVVSVAANLVQFVLALSILLPFLVWDGQHLDPWLVGLPVVICAQFVLTLGPAYLVAALQVSFRDTQHVLGVVLLLAFYLTPVFYRIESLPVDFRATLAINPMATVLAAYRGLLFDGGLPDARSVVILGVVSAVLLAIGYSLFSRMEPRFVEEL